MQSNHILVKINSELSTQTPLMMKKNETIQNSKRRKEKNTSIFHLHSFRWFTPHVWGIKKQNQKKSLRHCLVGGNNKKATNLQIHFKFPSPMHFLYARVCSSIADGHQGNEAECKLGVDDWEVTYVFHKIFECFPET